MDGANVKPPKTESIKSIAYSDVLRSHWEFRPLEPPLIAHRLGTQKPHLGPLMTVGPVPAYKPAPT